MSDKRIRVFREAQSNFIKKRKKSGNRATDVSIVIAKEKVPLNSFQLSELQCPPQSKDAC
jgi:hypothetical protein